MITPEQKVQFRNYVNDVPFAREHLDFVLDGLGIKCDFDYSRQSLLELERVFWEVIIKCPSETTDVNHFVRLMTQYMADCIIRTTGAVWIQSTDRNPMLGQPCLDGFGNQPWDRIYPVALAMAFVELRQSNPHFPGVSDRTVLAAVFDKATRIFAKTK